MNPNRLLSAALAAALLAGCAAPIFERAEIRKGTTWGGGASVNTGAWISKFDPEARNNEYDRHLSLLAVGYFRHGFSRRFGLFGQAGVGEGIWLSKSGLTLDAPIPVVFDLAFGCHIALTKQSTLRLNTGLANPFDFAWLFDAGPGWTTQLGLGLRGVHGGITHHLRLSRRLDGHLALSAAVMPLPLQADVAWKPAAQLGFAIERARR